MLTLVDIERAIAVRDPQLGELIVRYLGQSDPEPGKSELATEIAEDEQEEIVEVPAGAFTFDRLRGAVTGNALANKNATERKLTRRDAFASAEQSLFAPPRLKLGGILYALYEAGDPAG